MVIQKGFFDPNPNQWMAITTNFKLASPDALIF